LSLTKSVTKRLVKIRSAVELIFFLENSKLGLHEKNSHSLGDALRATPAAPLLDPYFQFG
jgi:hypothetical protein